MFCQKCGNIVDPADNGVCKNCGTRVDNGESPPIGGKVANSYIGVRRSGIVVLLLSIVTCGIYMYYWYYQSMEDINRASGEERINSVLWLVLGIFLPIALFVALYIIDQNLKRLSDENGVSYKEKFIIWLLLSFIGVGVIVAMFNVCRAYNNIWDKRQGLK